MTEAAHGTRRQTAACLYAPDVCAHQMAVAERGRRLQVTVTNGRGRPLRQPGLVQWLRRVAPAAARGQVNVVLVGARRIRTLNRQFRGIDRATDVLSFPMDDGIEGDTSSPPHLLGEIVISTAAVRGQARRFGHAPSTELRVLALHGLLHLLGYDHERDNGRMAVLERRLRRQGGLREGLIERAR